MSIEAINAAMHEAMDADGTMIILGEDVGLGRADAA